MSNTSIRASCWAKSRSTWGSSTKSSWPRRWREQLSLQTTSVAEITIKKEVLAMVTAPMAQMYRIVPIDFDGDTLTVAMCDPQNLSVQDELRTFLGFNIRVVVTTESAMTAALERYYGESTDSVESIVTALEDDAELAAAAAGISADGPINLDDVDGPGR